MNPYRNALRVCRAIQRIDQPLQMLQATFVDAGPARHIRPGVLRLDSSLVFPLLMRFQNRSWSSKQSGSMTPSGNATYIP